MRAKRWSGALLAWVGLVAVVGAAAAEPVWVDSAYLVERWGTADGLPARGTTGIHFSRSGFLWLTTFDGLVRFDGRRFTVFNVSRDPGLPGNRLIDLEEGRDGSLWVFTEQFALARFDGVRFATIGREQGLPDAQVRSHYLDADGTLWVGTTKGLARHQGEGIFRPWAAEAIAGEVLSILTAADGRLWVGTRHDGLYELDGETLVRQYRREDGLPSDTVIALATDPAGDLLVGTWKGAARLHDGSLEPLPVGAGEAVWAIRPAPDGELILLTNRRGWRWRPGEPPARAGRPTAAIVELLRVAPDGATWTVDQEVLRRNGVRTLEAPCPLEDFTFDPTGAVWLATSCDGLWRLRRRSVTAVTSVQGLPEGPVYGLAQTADGTLWAATADGTVSAIRDGGVVAVHDFGSEEDIKTLLAASDGRLWVGHSVLCVLDGASCETPPGLPELLRVRALYEGRDGSFWVGSASGVWRRRAGAWRKMDDLLGLTPFTIGRAMLEAASGNFWIGTSRDGLRRLAADGTVSRFGREHGLASVAIRDLYEDQRGLLWVATEDRGVCRSRQPEHAAELRFDCAGERQGLPSASLHRILPDGRGRLWFNSNGGVFWVHRRDLDRVLEGRASRVHARVFTERDGLPDREGNGGVQGAGLRLADGRLAFPGQGGVAIFDPRRKPAPMTPPRVSVDSLLLPGGREVPAAATMELRRGQRVFSVRFAGLTPGLTDPLFFRYRLLPSREAWTALGGGRLLSFERLRPGRYELQIAAVDATSGIIGPPATMSIHLPAYFYETTWFRITLLACLVGAAVAGHWRHRRNAARRQRRLEQTVAARTADVVAERDKLVAAYAELGRLNDQVSGAKAAVEEAHEDMLSMLDGLRLGVLILEHDGPVRFLSRAAQELLGLAPEQGLGRAWNALLDIDETSREGLQEQLRLAADRRTRLPVALGSNGERPHWVEVEIRDHPRDPQSRILLLYDVAEVYELRRLVEERTSFHGLVGQTSVMQLLFKAVRDVAPLDVTVLIEGETGTGKELVARAIHAASRRKDRPFVAVNCAGLTESLLASQLFGHRKGAFTGAVSDQVGLFEAADGGTLLLDEVGDLPPSVQSSLLRVLQEREIVRLGESRPRRVDVRILAATHRDLGEEVAAGRFREDLLYRIRVTRIRVPPLRERRDDIPFLANWFLTQARRDDKPVIEAISTAALRRLLRYGWPGNVRELKSAMESAAVACPGRVIQPEHLPPEIRDGRPPAAETAETGAPSLAVDESPGNDGPPAAWVPPPGTTDDDERRRILAALARTRGNRTAAARLLGIGRSTFYRRLQELEIQPP